jgi:hypothetical protein
MIALRGYRLILTFVVGAVAVIAMTGLIIWRDDILQALLDPKVPFAVYHPPAAPDYGLAKSWARLPGSLEPGDPPADVFFVHPTTFDGGKDWNGPVPDPAAERRLTQTMLPNYAAPFAAAGRVFAPLYRQASLYTSLTLFDDALEARSFAYGDVDRAFTAFLARIGPERPFIIVGAEQGGLLAARLLQDRLANDAGLRRRLIAVYLIDTVTPAVEHAAGSPIPACVMRDQAGCVAAWISAPRLDFERASRIMSRSVVWSRDGRLVGLAGREPLCFNPLLGAASDAEAPARRNLGAANASGLEWGARPGFMARQINAQCVAGILRLSEPRSAALRASGDWASRFRAPPYNLFWADLEDDSVSRTHVWLAGHAGASPLRRSDPLGASRTGPSGSAGPGREAR